MTLNKADFEAFEQQFMDLVSEFQSLSFSESKIRESLLSEAGRAEAAEARAEAAARGAEGAGAAAAAAAAGAAQAGKALATAQDELAAVKIQLELSERQQKLTEQKLTELSEKLSLAEIENERLRPLQSTHLSLQRQYVELQERIQNATTDARGEASKLENELRKVERCSRAGSEVRERARLAAAALARDRRLADAERRRVDAALREARAEITRLNVTVAELQHQLSGSHDKHKTSIDETNDDTAIRATLEAEMAGAAKLEKALSAALADNALLAAQLHSMDNSVDGLNTNPESKTSNICQIDSFLAE